MVRITEELVRKRSEHNEGIIGTLEELSLHQEDVEKIEHLNNWCKDLQILYLQANLISRIENLNKLKKLQYLNLAVNNIETIENLERCESLEKLDLTLNFIGDLESVASLKNNVHLKDLYLTGNPCCDFEGYRDYVIAQLPQLQNLDLKEIKISDRIKAKQTFDEAERKVKRCQEEYRLQREEQKRRVSQKSTVNLSDDEFWKSTSENCPETRVEIARRSSKAKGGTDNKEEKPKKRLSLFNKDGRPLNVNQAKLNFTFSDDDPEQFVLDVVIYKFLDTNLIEVDLQPIYVKLTVKGKIFQMVLPEEVHVERSTAQRSQTTGHLVLKMPRVNYKPTKHKVFLRANDRKEITEKTEERKAEYLEVEEKEDMDFSKIVENSCKAKDLYGNPEVPPLEYG
ncbi:protein tilB homolog [Anoplophora glabripennis]|uniref:protein tilB homolog n=1 Tax=Anoplophora glabripennis TaxID=217634 RepID=UPI00087524B6|nr:protein tilB homolog [Anoplophora glabripennis]